MRKVTKKQTVLDGKFNDKNVLSFEDQQLIRGGDSDVKGPIIYIEP